MKLREALRDAQQKLADAGVPSPDFDARALAAHVLDIPLSQFPIHQERLLTGDEPVAFDSLIACRARREPLQYLVGATEFYGLEFVCDRRALIPRPDTETLVDVALELADELGISRIADIGTGCGIIAVTLAARLPGAQVVATDASEEALALAAENVALHDLEEALVDGEPDGLGGCRAIVGECRDLPALRALVFEVGEGQAAAVAELMGEALAAREIIIRKDLGKIDRVVAAVL